MAAAFHLQTDPIARGESAGRFRCAGCDRYIYTNLRFQFDRHPSKGYPHHLCPGSGLTVEDAWADAHHQSRLSAGGQS